MINSISSWQVMDKLKSAFDTLLPLISTLWSYFENVDLKIKCSHEMHFRAIVNISFIAMKRQHLAKLKRWFCERRLCVKPAADSVSCFLLRWLWVLCLFVKLRQHSLCAVSPSDTTTVWPHSLLALLMVSLPLWLARQSSHPNQGPLHRVRTAPRYSRTPISEKKIVRLTCRLGFLPLHKAQCLHTHRPLIWVGRLLCIGTHNWRGAMRQTKRLYKSHTLSNDFAYILFSWDSC